MQSLLNIVVLLFIIAVIVATSETKFYYATENESVTLVCDKGVGIYTWFGPNQTTYAIDTTINNLLDIQDRLSVIKVKGLYPSFNLQIQNVSIEDEGQYKCRHGKTEADFKEKLFMVKIKRDPNNMAIENEEQNNQIYGYVNMLLNMKCTVILGIPSGTIEWKTDNIIIANGTENSIEYSFYPLPEHHLRNYTCSAKNIYTLNPIHRTIQLFLYMVPNVTVIQTSSDAIEGHSFMLTCVYESNHAIKELVWKFIGQSNKIDIVLPENETVLNFSRINRNQTGKYQCIVTNSAGSDTDTIDITVQYAPDVTVGYEATTSYIELKCVPKGFPEKYTFYDWEHKSFYNEHIRFLRDDGKGTLKLPRISAQSNRHHDNGIYVCRASNGIPLNGYPVISAEYVRNDSGIPYFVRSNKDTYYGIIGQDNHLSVSVVSISKLTNITLQNSQLWSLAVNYSEELTRTWDVVYGTNITVDARKITLTIKLNHGEDFQNYRIVVSNQRGQSYYNVNVKAASRPQSPNVIKYATFRTDIQVYWKPTFDGGYNQSIFIRYMKNSGKSEWKNVTAGTTNATLLRNLDSDTEYVFQMFSRNIVGDSDFTNEFIIKTEKKPRVKPEYVIVPVICVLLFVLSAVGYRKEKLLKTVILRCLKIDRSAHDVPNGAIGGVENNIYDFGNNAAVPVNNHEVPVYSSIDRRENIRLGQVMTYESNDTAQTENSYAAENDHELNAMSNNKQNGRKQGTKMHESSNLNYVEICFEKKPKDHKFIIRGSENKTPYAEIDFTQTAPYISSSEEDEDSDDDFMDIEDVKMMKKPGTCSGVD